MEQLSKIAEKLLLIAYEHWEKTSEVTFTYHFRNLDGWYLSTEAAAQLYKIGYIDNVSDSVLDDTLTITMERPIEPVVFDITWNGIRAAQSIKGKS